MMMYQLPIDMMTRMPSVMRATRSPPFHSASRPYGFSMTSVVFSPTLGVAAGALGAGATVVAGGGGRGRRRGRLCLRLGRRGGERSRQRNDQRRSQQRQAGHLQHVFSTQMLVTDNAISS